MSASVFRSFETQLSRVEAELLRREAPPSYGQLIAQGLIPPVEDFPVCSGNQVSSTTTRHRPTGHLSTFSLFCSLVRDPQRTREGKRAGKPLEYVGSALLEGLLGSALG